MLPQLGVRGSVPAPRKDSVDSKMIAVGSVIEPSTVTGAMRFGITSMNMIRTLPAPSDLAASMNSRSLICNTCPRTIRPIEANEKKVMTKIVSGVLAPNGAAVAAGRRADDDAQDHREPGRDQADEQRDPRAVHATDEDVPAEPVGAEIVVAVRADREAVVGDAELPVAEVGLVTDPLGDERRHQCHDDEQDDHH